MNIKANIPTPDNSGAIIQGRNGVVTLHAIEINTVGEGKTMTASIEGINKRGLSINGGFYAVPPQVMDDLATQWLQSRGFKVTKV